MYIVLLPLHFIYRMGRKILNIFFEKIKIFFTCSSVMGEIFHVKEKRY